VIKSCFFSDKTDAGDKDAEGVVFCTNNNDNDDSGNNFINSNLQDDDEFSPTFNVPDMDISTGAPLIEATAAIDDICKGCVLRCSIMICFNLKKIFITVKVCSHRGILSHLI